MTAQEKKSWLKDLSLVIVSVLGSLIIFGLTNKRDDESNIKKELQSLGENKANIEYVDKQDNAIKADINSKIEIVIKNQSETNSLLKELIIRK